MNTFEHDFYVGEKLCTIYVDSSHDEWKRIVINGQELVNEKYTLALNRKAYIIYYPIEVEGNELVISIDDNPLIHTYNLYLNGVSLLDGTRLDEGYLAADSILKEGFKSFLKDNWFKILKENLIYIIGVVCFMALINGHSEKEFTVRFLLSFVITPIALPAFIAGEWFHNKNIVKKYKSCFRPKKILSNNIGDDSVF